MSSYDELRRRNIKHTLIDYKYNIYTAARLREHLDIIEHKLKGNVGAIRYDNEMSGKGSPSTSNWIIKELDRKEKIEKELERINHQIKLVESWMCCLDPFEKEITNEYIINSGCSNVERSVMRLNLQYPRQLHRLVDKIIDKLMNN